MVVPPLYRKSHIPLVFLSQYGVRLLLFATRFRFFRFSNFHVSFCVLYIDFGSSVWKYCSSLLHIWFLLHCGCHIVVVMEASCDVDLVDGDLVGGLVIKQPGDNICLYHSFCFFLNRMYQTSSYTPRLLRAEINDFILSHPSTLLYLGPGSVYPVVECIALEHYSIERYVNYMSKTTSWGGAIELACLVHMYPVDIYVFQPHIVSRWMNWMTTFATSLPGRSHVNNFYLLYTGHNHYDCILDPVHHSLHLARIHDSESVAITNTTVGARVTASCASVKRQKVRYQSIIATRRGCIQHSRNEPRAALPRVYFRNRAILATKRLLAVSSPFKHYGDSVRFRRKIPRCLLDPAPSHSASDAIAYSDS